MKKLVTEALGNAGKGMGTSDPSGLGQSTDTSIKVQTDMAKLAQRYDDIDKKAKKLQIFSDERATLEDERMKVWWALRKLLKQKGLKEDHGMGFSHNVSIPQDDNTMNKPTIKEYHDSKSRKQAIISSDFDRGVALLFRWVGSNSIDYDEFHDLLADFSAKLVKHVGKVK